MEVPKDAAEALPEIRVSPSLFLMAAAQMHADGYFRPPSPPNNELPGGISQSPNSRVGLGFATLKGKL